MRRSTGSPSSRNRSLGDGDGPKPTPAHRQALVDVLERVLPAALPRPGRGRGARAAGPSGAAAAPRSGAHGRRAAPKSGRAARHAGELGRGAGAGAHREGRRTTSARRAASRAGGAGSSLGRRARRPGRGARGSRAAWRSTRARGAGGGCGSGSRGDSRRGHLGHRTDRRPACVADFGTGHRRSQPGDPGVGLPGARPPRRARGASHCWRASAPMRRDRASSESRPRWRSGARLARRRLARWSPFSTAAIPSSPARLRWRWPGRATHAPSRRSWRARCFPPSSPLPTPKLRSSRSLFGRRADHHPTRLVRLSGTTSRSRRC